MEEIKSSLLSQIQALTLLSATGNTDEILQSLKSAETLSFPGKRQEEWKYAPFNLPDGTDFKIKQGTGKISGNISIETFGESTVLVFLNGAYSELLSEKNLPSGLEIILNTSSDGLIAPYENTIFSQLNDATRSLGGISIRVAPKAVIEKPVIFLHIQTMDSSWSQPRVQVEVGERAEVSFAEIWKDQSTDSHVINSITEVKVAKSALVKWLNFEKGTSSLSMVHQTRVETEEKAIFQHITIALGEGYIRNNLEIKINGEYGDAHMYGLTLGDNKFLVDHHTFVNHKPENTTSSQLYKGIFAGKSTGIFNGKILVDQPAQKTNAYQSSKNILLSKDARVFAKPQLEIFADDVKCSHGATIGQLDEEPIFYLRSRGLDLPTARMLLVQAFASEIFMKIENKDLRQMVEEEVLSSMDRMISN